MKKLILSLLLFASLAEGVTAQNRFYGFSGNVNNDLGTGNNGTPSNVSYTTDRFGVPNAALNLVGAGSNVNLGQIAAINGQTNFTIAGWFKKPNAIADRVLFGIGPNILCKTNHSGHLRLLGYNGCNIPLNNSVTTYLPNQTRFTAIPGDAWFHLAYVNQNGIIKTYINGLPYGESTQLTGAACSGVDFLLGEHSGTATTANWDTGMDDLFIIGQAYTPAQIDSLKNLPDACIASIGISQQPVDLDLTAAGPQLMECYSSNPGASYQWQISRDGGNTFVDLANNAIYQDVQTPSLIIDASDSLNAFLFRAKLTTSTCLRYSDTVRLAFKKSLFWGFDGSLQSLSNTNNFTYSGGGNTLTYTADRFGNPNRALRLASTLTTTSSVTTAGVQFLASSPEFTYTGWYLSNAMTFSQSDVYFVSPSANATYGTVNSVLVPIANIGSAPVNTFIKNPFLNGATWHHFALVYRGGVSKLYVNGQLVSQSVNTGKITPANMNTFSMTNKFLFGSSYSVVQVDDLLVTNYALSPAQVDSLYNLPNPCQAPIPITLQPQTVTLNGVGNTQLSCNSSASVSYQWQVSTNNGQSFTNITNNAIYNNATTNTLDIAADMTLQGYKYRCALSNGTSCTGRYTDTVMLTILNPVESVYYSFNNGTAVNDLGTGFNGTVVGGAALMADRFGNPNRAYKINANGAKINCGNITFMNGTPQLTINGWFQKQNSIQKYLFSKGGSVLFAQGGLASSLNNSTQPALTPAGQALFNSISEGSWMMFTGVFNNGMYTIYVNGVQVASVQTPVALTFSNTNSFLIGGHETIFAPDPSLNNGVDDIYIVNRALSPQQIDSLYNVNACGVNVVLHPENKILQADYAVVFQAQFNQTVSTLNWQVSTDGGLTYTNLSNNATYSGVNTNLLTVNATNALDGYKYRLVAGTGTCLVATRDAILTYAKAVAYSFNAATTQNDLGANNTGVVTGTSFVADRFGNPNKALFIGGGLNRMEIGNLPFMANANTFTYSAWYQKTNTYSTAGEQMFTATAANSGGTPVFPEYLRSFAYYDGNPATFALIHANVQNGTTALVGTNDGYANIPRDDWFHYVYVWNKPTLSIYINGELYASVTPGVTPNGFSSNLANGIFMIGSYPSTPQGWQQGIDDIYITNKALTPDQIDSLYQVPNPCAPVAVNITPAEFDTICHGSTVKLTVLNEGATYTWFDQANNGNNLGTGNTFTSPNLTTTTTYYVEASSPTCTSIGTRTAITTQVKAPIASPLDATPTQNKTTCPGGYATLQATAGAGQNIRWYDAATGGNLLGSGSSFTTPVLNANTSFFASAIDGLCESANRTQIDVVVNASYGPQVTVLPYSCPTNILGSTYRFPVKVVSEGNITIGSFTKEAQFGDTASFLLAPNQTFTVNADLNGCIATQSITTPAFTPNGVAVANSACQSCAIRDNKNYTLYDLASTQKLVGVIDNSNNEALGHLDVCVNVASAFTLNGTNYLGRNFHITPDTSSSAVLRLFFTPAELAALVALDPTTNLGNLYVVAFDGQNETPQSFSAFTTYGPFVGATDVSGNHYVDVTVNGFSGFYITSALATPLPLSDLQFTATRVGSHAKIEWKGMTADEVSSYTLSRSVDGIKFNAIYTTGADQRAEYDYVDMNPNTGRNYYRLTMTDHDGRRVYSQVISVVFAQAENQVMVMPNPASNEIMVRAIGFESCEIFDMRGTPVLQSSDAKMNIQSLVPGIYHIRVMAAGEQSVIKFVKQ